MKAKDSHPVPLDHLRRDVSSLLAASGVRPDRASALANSLLWFDSAGLGDHGVATLPDLLDRIALGGVAPKAEGKIGPERAATAVLDGQNGPPALVLARAAEVASEKAREYGSGLVRVRAIGPIQSALEAVSEIAIGPAIGSAFGPDGAWSVALPSSEGLPLLADALLGSDPAALAGLAPWSPLLGGSEWIIQAVSVPAMEPLASFHMRVAEFAKRDESVFLPAARWEQIRRQARESGVSLSHATVTAIKASAKTLGVAISL